jgi:hypothetical protein
MMRLALAFLVASPVCAFAQRSVVLSKPDAEFGEPFSAITGVRPLGDGRVLVTDNKDKVVQIIDFKGGVARIGREGSGPGEYLTPNAIAALPGDSSAIWDGANHRYLMISPEGKPVREFRLDPTAGIGPSGYGAFAATLPRGVDARGNIYFQGSPITRTANGSAPAESIPVIRFDRARQRPDTVAHVRPAKGNATVTPGPDGRGMNVSNGMANPLLPLDEWVVLPDGRVAVVRGEPYRIDFYVAGAIKSSGPRVVHQNVPVDDAVKRMVTEQRRRQLQGSVPRMSPTGNVSTMQSEGMKRFMNLEPWPAYLPAFTRDAAIVRPMGEAGQIWVLRTKRSEAEAPAYDVFDATGRVVARVQLPANTRVIAFGAGVVYVIRVDDDDLQYLQRYQLAGV